MKFGLLLLKLLLKAVYRVKVIGIENYAAAGPRVIIMPNHQSLLDPPLLTAFLPEKPNFAINTIMAKKLIVRSVLWMFKVFKLDPTNPMSAKSLMEFVEAGNKVVIFPEGRVTVTGSLMKVYEGSGMIAAKTGAMILPVRIENAEYSKFSYMRGKLKSIFFPKITITILPPFKLESNQHGKAARAEFADKLERMMSETMFAAYDIERPLISAVIDAAELHGRNYKIAEDIKREPMTYGGLFTKAYALGEALKPYVKGNYVGVLLPNSVATLVTVFALHNLQKVPAMLNYSAGAANLNNANRTAQIQTVLSSKMFIQRAGLEDLVKQIHDVQIIYLEDIAKDIQTGAKLKALLLSHFPRTAFKTALKSTAASPAVLLFTSGSEGVPKGVALSHKNLLANIRQADSVIDIASHHIYLNVLPMFHSFGLTIGTFLPLVLGIRAFHYPSPLHYNIIPEVAYATKATILCGTDTFLKKYGEAAHPYDFFSVKHVITGAEKLKDSTRKLWMDKFGLRILEGYGVTETSPFLAANTPMFNRHGSVGKIIPGVEVSLRPVEGIKEGAELWVKGPNIMLGYIKLAQPGHLQPPDDGWYGTGDIVKIDDDGYVFIIGRAQTLRQNRRGNGEFAIGRRSCREIMAGRITGGDCGER